MKILSSGDHHFEEGHHFSECIRVHENILKVAKSEDVDLFLSSGDVFERQSTPLEREAVADFLTAMAKICPVVVAKGNHETSRDVLLMNRLRTVHPVTVVEDAQVVWLDGVAVAAVAWPESTALKMSGMEPREALQAVLRCLGEQMSGFDGAKVLLGHFMVDGSIASTGQPLLGLPINVGLDDLALAGAHLGVLGHIHKAQQWDINGNPHCYTGSPFRTDFSQLEEKTMLFAEFDGPKLVRLENIPTGATPMAHLAGEWSTEERTLRVEWEEEAVRGARVRMRYQVPRDERTAAWNIAQDYKRAILECGAETVKVEEVPIVVNRARAPDVARSRSIADMLPPHWESIGFEPGIRKEPLLEKANQAVAKVGTGSSGPTWLRLHSAKFRAMGPHKGDFEFDLDAHPLGSVIAFTGPNGAGKSSTLELSIGGACHRRTQSQGTLTQRALARDSVMESVITSGPRTFTLRHTIDAVTGKSDALVLNEQGKAEYKGTSVKTFDAWAPKFLPDPAVLYSTQFSAQPAKKSRRRFIELDSAERTSVVLKTIGVERVEDVAAECRAQRDKVAIELDKAQTRLRDEQERIGDIDLLKSKVVEEQGEVAHLEMTLAQAEMRLAKLVAANQSNALEEARREGLRQKRDAILADVEKAKTALSEASTKVSTLEERLKTRDSDELLATGLDELRARVTEAEKRAAEIAAIKVENDKVEARVTKLESDLKAVDAEIETAERRIKNSQALLDRAEEIRSAEVELRETEALLTEKVEALREREQFLVDMRRHRAETEEKITSAEVEIAHLETVLLGSAAVVEAVAVLPELQERVATLVETEEAAGAVLEWLQNERISGADDRIASLRGGLLDIALEPGDALAVAKGTIAADDQVVEAAEALPGKLTSAKEHLADTRRKTVAAKAALDIVEKRAVRAQEMEVARETLAKSRAFVEPLRVHIQSDATQLAVVEGEVTSLRVERQKLSDTAEKLRQVAAEAGPLNTAEAMVEELRNQRDAATARRDKLSQNVLEEQGALIPSLNPIDATPFVEPLGKAEAALARLTQHNIDQALLDAELPRMAEAEAKVKALELSLLDFGDLSPVDVVETKTDATEVELYRTGLQAARSDLAVAQSKVDAVQVSSGKMVVICQERDRLAADLADWTRLSLDFGRAGIQSALVDAAGPELTDLCNELLRECHGSRFTISIETKRLSADGKQEIDEFIVNVIDTEQGGERDAQKFSGGERVFLGEVVENALLMLGCIRADAQHPTIVRDESGAALDPANSRAYLLMLRLVVKKTRAANLLLVTHSPELQAMCDARIELGVGGNESPVEEKAEAAE